VTSGTPFLDVYRRQLSLKVSADRVSYVIRIASRFEPKPIFTVVKTQKSTHAYLVVCPIHSAQVSFAVATINI
jgi:hypothetical protein